MSPAYKQHRRALALGSYHLWRPGDGEPIVGVNPRKQNSYIVLRRVHYESRLTTLEIPKGFVTDLASIPWWLRWLPFLDPTNPKYRSALIHDLAYQQQEMYREDADNLFRSGLKADGVAWWIRQLMFYGVRIGGGFAWREHAKRNAAARNRVQHGDPD